MTIEWWQVAAILIIGAYGTVAGFAALGLLLYARPHQAAYPEQPLVSVVVAARNEGGNIESLCESLLALDYPRDKMEIIIADDGSTDDTARQVQRLSRQHGIIRLVSVSKVHKGLNGKANAIHRAVVESSGAVVFVTDADCRVPRQWIRAHLAYYDANTVMVGGFTLLTEPGSGAGLFARLQSLDWLFLIATGSGFSRWNRPLSVFGNNLSFRRSAYDEIGGYPAVGFSLVEDFALMRAMRRSGGRIRLPPDPAALVLSQPAAGFKSFMQQRRRWALGFRGFSPLAKCIAGLGGAARLLCLALFVLGVWKWGAAVLAGLYGADLLLVLSAAWRLGRRDQLRPIALLEPYTAAHNLLLLPAFAFGRSVTWKSRVYREAG